MTSENPPTTGWLEFIRSGERVFLEAMCTIGRDAGNRIVIPTEKVSRRHAVLRRTEDGAYQIMDMGSSNGTYVNGARIARPLLLTNGSVIEVGGERFIYRTPPVAVGQTTEGETSEGYCWLLAVEAVERGGGGPLKLLGDKTFEGWSERCQRLMPRLRAKALRPGGDALLFYWVADAAGTATPNVVEAVRTLLAAQTGDEEFHLTLHYALMKFRQGSAGDVVPGGLGTIHALEMHRLFRTVKVNVLLSDTAQKELGESAKVRRLTVEERGGYKADLPLYTIER
jgi:pSer/pThr/pTyr-binding forkhead associated (FHA) protein